MRMVDVALVALLVLMVTSSTQAEYQFERIGVPCTIKELSLGERSRTGRVVTQDPDGYYVAW